MGAFDRNRQNIVIPDPDKPAESAAFREKWGWEPHEQIMVRPVFTAGIQEAVGNAATLMDSEGNMSLRAGTGRTTMLEHMIVSWTLTDNGIPVKVTPENIRELPAEYTTPVLEVCDRLAVGSMSKKDQKRFLDSANGHSSASSAGAKIPLRQL